jgi:RsiW-degrading membrane proteinase PrsW (M82 family)
MTKPLNVALMVVSVVLMLGGLFGLVLYFIVAGTNTPEDTLQIGAIFGAVSLVLLGFGAVLLFQSIRALQHARARRFDPPLWIMVVSFVAVLGLGSAVLAAGWPTNLLFPALHALAAVIPAVAILAIVPRWGYGTWRRARRSALATDSDLTVVSYPGYPPEPAAGSGAYLPTWRSISRHLAFGAFASSSMAIVIELVVGAVIGLFILLAIAGNGELDGLLNIFNQFERSGGLSTDLLQQLLLSPAVLIGMAAVMVVVAPLTEEFFKSLGVALFAPGMRHPAQAWALGLAAGLGFALLENLLYSGVSLSGWWSATLLRVGTAIIHALATGVVSLGWYYALREHRPWRLAWAFAGSVSLHGLWNGLALISLVASVSAFGQLTDDLLPPELGSTAGLLILGSTALILILGASALFAIVYISRRLERA